MAPVAAGARSAGGEGRSPLRELTPQPTRAAADDGVVLVADGKLLVTPPPRTPAVFGSPAAAHPATPTATPITTPPPASPAAAADAAALLALTARPE